MNPAAKVRKINAPDKSARRIFLRGSLRPPFFFARMKLFGPDNVLRIKSNRTMTPSAIDSRAFEEFVRRHSRIIGKVCYLYAADGNDFDDLYQEVLLHLWQGLGTFAGRSQTSSWVYRVALNTCITQYRRNRHRRDIRPLSEALACIDEEPAHRERLAELSALIARLDPMEKAILTLWLDELPYDEIATITGLARNTVASRLHRIRLKLRDAAER